MIGILTGQVIFSDGVELILQTQNGIGYQMFSGSIYPEGERALVFVSHIIRENSETLFAFKSLREKKLFELLTTVKGVGPKSAYAIVSYIGVDQVVHAVVSEDKKTLTQVSGVGDKAASQILLDLKKKIIKIKMYSSEPPKFSAVKIEQQGEVAFNDEPEQGKESQLETVELLGINREEILNDTILACQNLGFQTEKIVPLAQRILKENAIKKPEQLVHLVLKEI